VVLGATAVDELFPTGTGVGQDVTIDGTPYTVIGELEPVLLPAEPEELVAIACAS
jgi:hypothetical protein